MVQSVARALKILELVAKEKGMGVSEVARELDMNKSTVFGLIKTLEDLGYFFKDNLTGNYRITYKLMNVASMDNFDDALVNYARKYMENLSEKYNETVHFVKGLDNSVVYIAKLEGTRSIRVYTGIGTEMPMHCTGVGKAILAYRDNKTISNYVQVSGLPKRAKNTITDEKLLFEDLARIKERGYSIDDEEIQDDLYCIAFPIKNSEGRIKYAISVTLPKFRLSELHEASLIEDIRIAALNIEGYFRK